MLASLGKPVRRYVLAAFSALLAVAPFSAAQSHETGFLDRSITVERVTYRYQVYVPSAYDPAESWPLILFLHGASQRGDDGIAPTDVGLGTALRRYPERYPAIAVFPQIPRDTGWPGPGADRAMAILDNTMSEFNIDAERVYLTGISIGGSGAWYLAYTHPREFAAVVPIAGEVGDARGADWIPEADNAATAAALVAEHLKDMPIWVFHGESDPTVRVQQSRRIVRALEALGSDVKYTEFPRVGHNSWDPAYATPELATWLFAQRNRRRDTGRQR